jgi:hypothetical protein
MSKETRVYVLSADDFSPEIGGFALDIWNDSEQAGEDLPDEAKRFITMAEEIGQVYSLKGFMVAFNINEEVGMNDYVFITQAY